MMDELKKEINKESDITEEVEKDKDEVILPTALQIEDEISRLKNKRDYIHILFNFAFFSFSIIIINCLTRRIFCYFISTSWTEMFSIKATICFISTTLKNHPS